MAFCKNGAFETFKKSAHKHWHKYISADRLRPSNAYHKTLERQLNATDRFSFLM